MRNHLSIKELVESNLSEDNDRQFTKEELDNLNELQDRLSGLIFFLKNEQGLLHPDNIRNNGIMEYRMKKVKPLLNFLDEVDHLKYKLTNTPL